jgi:cellulose biosynthesis protein BcsQ
MQSIAFFNNKGGVGKTTLLCNTAAFLAIHLKKKILVVDADPQCNATQLMMADDDVFALYNDPESFTIHSIIHPLSLGKGYSENLKPIRIENYGVDLIPGDPRLALKEDLLSKDWQDAIAGDIRGLRTSFLFYEFLTRCKDYDLVLFDLGPSLGSINRSVLLGSDFFVSPMSIDIFSLKAIENISIALVEWRKRLKSGIGQVDKTLKDDIPSGKPFDIKFSGYVAQQYIQKTTSSGHKRAVVAYENIMKRIPKTISTFLVTKLQPNVKDIRYEIGTIPNLYSLIPMAQTAHKPVFALKAKDGVRGAHFNKVREAQEIFRGVTTQLPKNVTELSK